MISTRIDSREQTERRFQEALHAAMGHLGWIHPDTEAAVRATSKEDGEVEIPAELSRRELNIPNDSVLIHEANPNVVDRMSVHDGSIPTV